MSGDFIIEPGGRELARATKPSAFRDTIVVHYGRRDFTLRKPSVWRRAFALMDGERQIGSISPESTWTRRATAEPARLTCRCHTAFVIWLVIVLWKRDAQSAGGLTTASVRVSACTGVLDDGFHVIEVLAQRAMAGLGQ